MKKYKMLLQDDISMKEKYGLLLSTIQILRKVESQYSYQEMLDHLIPVLEKNIATFEKSGNFLSTELTEYVTKLELFLNEFLKYQVWLFGSVEDCKIVKQILNYEKVHVLGETHGEGIALLDAYDYVIVCGQIDENQLTKIQSDKIVRYDFLRFCHYGISPECAYLELKLKQKLKSGVEGAVTGLSYEQRGIKFDKLKRNLVCLATPSQDLYLDYKNFLWLYDEVVNRKNGILKYCVIGMDFYRLWYDLSKSDSKKIRMLFFYKRLKCIHHFHDWDSHLVRSLEDLQVCSELMVEDYMDIDYINSFHPERYYGDINDEYNMTEDVFKKDSEEVRRVFDKPYPLTFQENVGILESFLKFLNLHNIHALVYVPPFPRIFNQFTPENMKKTTLDVLAELKEKYEFELLDLSGHELFEDKYFADWSHLNSMGAERVTEILNDYMDLVWKNNE